MAPVAAQLQDGHVPLLHVGVRLCLVILQMKGSNWRGNTHRVEGGRKQGALSSGAALLKIHTQTDSHISCLLPLEALVLLADLEAPHKSSCKATCNIQVYKELHGMYHSLLAKMSTGDPSGSSHGQPLNCQAGPCTNTATTRSLQEERPVVLTVFETRLSSNC